MKLGILFLSCFCFCAVSFAEIIITIVTCSGPNFGCQSCFTNSDSEELCASCLPGYKEQNQLCIYDISYCTALSGFTCNIGYCQKQSSLTVCQQCLDKFILNSNICTFNCNTNSNGYVIQPLDCFNNCGIGSNCYCNTQNSGCIHCTAGKYFYKGFCYYQCQESFFPNERNTCISCPTECKTCTSSTNCTTCKFELLTNSQTCQCPSGKYFFNNICVDKCPFSTTRNGSVCKRSCDDSYYQYKDQGCQLVESRWSRYCNEVISYLSELVYILDYSNFYNYGSASIKIKILEVPTVCFDILLYGASQDQEISILYFQKEDNAQTYDMHDINYLNASCSTEYCVLYLKVFLQAGLKSIFNMKFNKNTFSLLDSKMIFSGDEKELKSVCASCPLPQDYIVHLNIFYSDFADQSYDGNTLTASGDFIQIIQKIDNSIYKSSIIYGHSARQIYEDGSYSVIQQYYQESSYVNGYQSTNGQLYFYLDSKLVKNKSTIQFVSFIKQVEGTRFLSYSTLPIVYLVQTFKIILIDNKGNDTNLKLYIGVGVGGFFVLIIMICLIRYCRRKRSESIHAANLSNKEQSTQQSQRRKNHFDTAESQLSLSRIQRSKSERQKVELSFTQLTK